eukprot:458914_1
MVTSYTFQYIVYGLTHSNNYQQSHTRSLLNNKFGKDDVYLEEQSDIEILNLNTYDEFDWVILVLGLLIFACIFFCYGWCLHKMCVYNKVAGNADADVETLATKLSFTQRGLNAADFFRGFSLRGTLRGKMPKMSNFSSKKRNSKLKNPKWNAGLTSITECKHTKKTPNSATLKLPTMPANMMPTIPSGDEIEIKEMNRMDSMNSMNRMDSNRSDRSSINSMLDQSFPAVAKNKGLKKRFTPKSLMTPGFTPGLPSPGSTAPSMTHISMQMPYEYSDNPYKRAVRTNKLVDRVGNKGNKNINEDRIVIVYEDEKNNDIDEDAIDATTPLTTPL